LRRFNTVGELAAAIMNLNPGTAIAQRHRLEQQQQRANARRRGSLVGSRQNSRRPSLNRSLSRQCSNMREQSALSRDNSEKSLHSVDGDGGGHNRATDSPSSAQRHELAPGSHTHTHTHGSHGRTTHRRASSRGMSARETARDKAAAIEFTREGASVTKRELLVRSATPCD
jgi:hypothetical protein